MNVDGVGRRNIHHTRRSVHIHASRNHLNLKAVECRYATHRKIDHPLGHRGRTHYFVVFPFIKRLNTYTQHLRDACQQFCRALAFATFDPAIGCGNHSQLPGKLRCIQMRTLTSCANIK